MNFIIDSHLSYAQFIADMTAETGAVGVLLSAYRAWVLLKVPPIPTRWWQGAKRWSFNTLWRQYRSAFWGSTLSIH